MPAPLLVAPCAVAGLRAPQVAAAVARGVERAGLEPPDLCPLAGGGLGTREVLLLGLGGETAGEVALLEGGGTALVEAVPGDPAATGGRVADAVACGAAVVLLAADVAPMGDAGAATVAAVQARGGLGHARLVVLCAGRRNLVPLEHTGGGLAGTLASALGARLEHGPSFVLDALDVRQRMRRSGAVIVGADRLSTATLSGTVEGDLAVDARQDGVPSHAVCREDALLPFDQRILDLQHVLEAPDLRALEDAGAFIAANL